MMNRAKFSIYRAALGAAILAISIGATAAKLSKDDAAQHALDRLTFGAKPGDLERVRNMGVQKWIEQQLHPEQIAENSVLEPKLRGLETVRMTPRELVDQYPPKAALKKAAEMNKMDPNGATAAPKELSREEVIAAMTPEQRRAMRFGTDEEKAQIRRELAKQLRPQGVIGRDLNEAKIFRAVYSERQLNEVLADFWFNHFNVFFDKGADRYLVADYEREAIRAHVLGKFEDLVKATAQHPAMLFYLDNWQSVSPDSPGAQRLALVTNGKQKRGLNENYARELMELHTLGVDGGYTQKDVTEVARCFTGWTIRQPRQGGGFEFNPRLHDRGEKIVLGHKIPAGGGMDDGMKVIDILVHHPSAARFISRKLAVRFVSDNPPQALVDRMAATFQKTDGDLRAVLKTMLESKEFWAPETYRAKMKSPFEMVISAIRATGGEVTSGLEIAKRLSEMGQPLYRKQEPTGYSNSSEEWVNSAALLARMNFASALAANKIPGVKVDTAKFGGLRELSPETQAAVAKAPPAEVAGLLLGSPDFQKR